VEKPLQLAIPLKQNQIDAATQFWASGWESKEFEQLRMAFPNPLDAVRIKAIVLNALCGTNIIAIAEAADCVGHRFTFGRRATHPGSSCPRDLWQPKLLEFAQFACTVPTLPKLAVMCNENNMM
jgi:hypothetical protein